VRRERKTLAQRGGVPEGDARNLSRPPQSKGRRGTDTRSLELSDRPVSGPIIELKHAKDQSEEACRCTGSVAAMWGSVLVLALVTVPDPPRLFAMFLVTSRPQPGKNLLFYYLGCLVLNFWFLLVPLTVLHFLPNLGSLLQRYAPPATPDGGASLQPIPLAIGVLSLLIAARLAMRIRARPTATDAIAPEADTALDNDAAPEPKKPNPISAAMSRLITVDEGSSGALAAIRRALGRVYSAWKEGSVWISLCMGLTYSPLQATAVLALIATSGAPILTQLGAAISFVGIMLAIIEIILVGYFLAPTKTEAVLQSTHGWTQNHSLEVFASLSAVSGVFLLAKGLGVF